MAPAIPDDITAYYDKIDNEEDENDEQVQPLMGMLYHMRVMWLSTMSTFAIIQIQVMSFEIKQDMLETLQKKYYSQWQLSLWIPNTMNTEPFSTFI